MVDLATSSQDPENPGLMDCYMIYKGLNFMEIKVGWGKTPYSRSSLVPFIYSPYWQRPEFLRGDIFARRDVGVTLQGSYLKQRLNLFLGTYTGLGEVSLRGNNDNSGKLEYMARAEFAYPSRFKYRVVDYNISPQPMMVLGINGRYANKKLNGSSFPSYAIGEYNMKVIDGTKYSYGFDLATQYKGFSSQFEYHYMVGQPQNINHSLLNGYDTDFFTMYGFAGEITYFFKKRNTIISSRYEQFDLNDLGNSLELSFSKQGLVQLKTSSQDQALEIVRRRIDEIGTNEPNILKRGNDRILVELPGLDDPMRIKSLLGKTANLTFRFVTTDTEDSFGSVSYTHLRAHET